MEMASNGARRGLAPLELLEAEMDLAEDAPVAGPDVNSPRTRRRRRQNAAARRYVFFTCSSNSLHCTVGTAIRPILIIALKSFL
jgi:hypothetical protein